MIMRAAVLLLAASLYACAAPTEIPPEPTASEQIDPELELAALGSYDGVWEGSFAMVFDPVGAYRDRESPLKLRITIDGTEVDVQYYDEEQTLRPLAYQNYMQRLPGTALVYCVNGGNGYIESFTIFLAHVAEQRMEGHVSRGVHNYLVRNTSPWRVMPVHGPIVMERLEQ